MKGFPPLVQLLDSLLSPVVIVAFISTAGGIAIAFINKEKSRDKRIKELAKKLNETNHLLTKQSLVNQDLKSHIEKIKALSKVIYEQYARDFAGDPSKIAMLKDLKEAIEHTPDFD